MTFWDRITADSGRALRYSVAIEGVAGSFTMDASGSPSDLVDGRGMLVSADEAMSRLDIYRMIQTGGGMLIKVQDDDAKTLRGAFAPRVRPVAYINQSRAALTEIQLNTTSTLLGDSGTVYIGAETITYTGRTATLITGCTRGAFGSRAFGHRGTADHGVGVYLSPPSWYGRRVTLTGILKGEDGSGDLSAVLGTYRLEEAPQTEGKGIWELRCSHLSDELAKRKLGQGLGEVEVSGQGGGILEPAVVSGVDVFRVVVEGGIGRLFVQGEEWISHAVVQFGDGAGDARTIFPIHSVAIDDPTAGFDTIYLYRTALTRSGQGIINLSNYIAGGLAGGFGQNPGRLPIKWMKHIALLQVGVPHVLLLIAMISKVGDAQEGTYDVLPGALPNGFGGPGFQLGAGINVDEIDIASLEAVANLVPQGWAYPIDDEIPVTDIIESFARATSTAAVYSRDGKLTFRQMRGEKRDIVAGIAQPGAVRGAIVARVEEHHTFPRARVRCNYDPIDAEFEAEINVIDQEMADTYPNAEATLEISDRAIVIEPVDDSGLGSWMRPGIPAEELLPMLRRTMIGTRGGALILSMRVDARLLHLQLGDLVDLNLPEVGDFRGGTLTSARGRIIGRKPHWSGVDALSSDIEVLVEEKLQHIAPVMHIGAIVDEGAGIKLLTVSAVAYAGSTENAGEAPARAQAFRVGDAVRLYRPSTGAVPGGQLDVTQIVSATQMRINDYAEGYITVGDVLVHDYASAYSNSGLSTDGFRTTDYAYGPLGADVGFQGRWR